MSHHCRRIRSAGRGFSFVELLFAMAVLSLGMIGVASALYFGVDQTRSTLDDSIAAALARQAAAQLGQLMTTVNAPNGSLIPIFGIGDYGAEVPAGTPKLNDLVRPIQLCASDPRFAWSALYRRGNGGGSGDAPTADVVVAVLRSTVRSQFTPADLTVPNGSLAKPDLVPAIINVSYQQDATTGLMTLDLADGLSTNPSGVGAVAPGAFLVLSVPPGAPNVALDGQVVRVAERVSTASGDVWTLAPGYDLHTTTAGTAGAYVFGRGYADPVHPEKGYAGPNQAVAVYCTTVLLH